MVESVPRMGDRPQQTEPEVRFPLLRHRVQATVADQVYEVLKQQLLSLDLPPGTRISETDVANKMGVSRQPVREAFKRLAKLGFLDIRPQSSTTVSLISEEAILRALYIRTALEVQTCQTACQTLTNAGDAALRDLIDQQKSAIEANDKVRFHDLDEAFHKEICIQSDVGYVWDHILENKAHMDRVRMLSINPYAQKEAFQQHVAIYEALLAREPGLVVAAMTEHLSSILTRIQEVKSEKHHWIVEDEG